MRLSRRPEIREWDAEGVVDLSGGISLKDGEFDPAGRLRGFAGHTAVARRDGRDGNAVFRGSPDG